MSNINFQKAFNMSVLAEAAYYEGADNKANHLEGTQWDKIDELRFNEGIFSYANSTWEVIYHVPNNNTGLQFYLVKDKVTNAYTLAFSGTSAPGGNNPRNPDNDFSDMGTDVNNALGSIADIYSPFPIQLFDAINHIIKLSTPAGQNYQKLYWNPISIEDKNLIYSTPSTDNTTDYLDRLYIGESNDVGLGLIPQGTDISLTGQSLGGFLVQALTLIDPANNIEKGYSFNGPGVSEKITSILQIIKGSVLDPAIIENWYGEPGFEIITPPIAQQGERIGFYAEAGGHNKEYLTNALAIAALIQNIAPNLTVETANSLFYAMYFDEAGVLEKSLNDFAKIFDKNWNYFDKSDYDIEHLDQRADFFDKIKNIKDSIAYKNFIGQGQIYLMNNADILNQMASKIEIRYALKNLNVFYISGLDYTNHNVNKELDVYSEQTEIGSMTEQFMKDRVAMISKIFQGNTDNLGEIDTGKSVYELESLDGKRYLYQDYDKKIDVIIGGGGGNALLNPQSKIIFGSSGIDIIEGGIESDHLYGGNGGDTLKGGGSDDYLEGGDGDDYLYGEGDNDKLIGMTGDDHLYGGDGNDHLYGGRGNDELYAGKGDDYLEGGNGSDNLYAGDDHDTLVGMNGIDYLYGGNGNDVLLGGAENDELHGGDGNDYLNGGSEVDLLDGGNGNDVLVGGAGWLQAEGGDGNDIIYADQYNINLLPDDLSGGAGNDIIYAGMGQATIKGGYGNDLIYGGNSNDIIEGGTGVNILQGGAGTDNFKFYTSPVLGAYETTLIKDTNGIITINGTQLEVGEYNQDIKAWYSADNQYIIKKIEGDAGQTLISIYQKDDNKTIIYVDGWKSNGDMGLSFSEIPPQTIPSTENLPLINDGNNIAYQQNQVNAGGGNDYVEGTLGNDIIQGGNGNNFINGLDGDDVLQGGDDQDILLGGTGKDIISGGGGNDLILSSAEYTITSGYFASQLHAHVYNLEELENKIANNSADNFNINFIYDAKYSEDSQSYTYYFRKDGIVTPILLPDIQFQLIANGEQSSLYSVFSLLETDDGGATGSDQVHGGAGDDFILGSGDADQLYGELDADYLYGRGGDDDLYGGQGQDHIYGGSGRDHINGGTENDLLVGGYEADVIFGGDGVDVILGDLPNYIGTDAPPASADTSRYGDDLIYGGKGGDTLRGNGGNDIIHGENDGDFIFGEEGSDILYGGQGKDNIDGGDGEDIVFGGTEDDKLYGKAKNDTLFGGSGIDHLYGGEDDDLLYGDSGNDLLYGGAGSDLYVFSIGDGQDTVIEQLSDIASLNYQNFIYFTFDPSQIKSVIRDEFNLVVRYGTDDQITVRDYYKVRNTSNHSYLENQELFEQIEISELRFEDGTIWDTAKIMELAPPPEVNELPLEARDDVAYFVDALASRDTIAVQGKTTITYSFPLNSASGSQPFYLEQMNAIEQALGKFAELLNISFVRSETGAGDLKFYLDDLTEVDAGAAAGYASATSGQVHLNSAYFNTSASLNEGQYGFEVLLHEIGHAMGLEHPFEAPVLPELENNQNNTIMSYTHNGANDTELKIYDMAALHYLHGVNLNVRAENNTYGFADKYIWDGNGVDTFDASEQTQNVFIDLNAGGWSFVGQKSQSILAQGQNFIGYGTTIENAIGSSANDILISNEANNVLQGRNGQDTYIFNENFGYDEIIETDSENIIMFDFEMDERFLFYRDGEIHYQNNTLKVDLDKITSFEMNHKNYTREEFKSLFLAVDRIYWGTETADTIQVQVGNNKIYGEAGDDQLFGGVGNDQIYGGVGKDYLVGGQGDDVLDGGSENDTLDGGYGINTFVFGRGYGNDRILYSSENNKIQLLGLNPEDIVLKVQDSVNLLITIKNSNDTLLLDRYFAYINQYPKIIRNEHIEFENGTVWYREDIKIELLKPTEKDDRLEGLIGESYILSGLAGNDQLYGADKNDQFFGGSGNDKLVAYAGDDILVGDQGYDELYGGSGNDTYIFSRGDGRDTIDDKRSSSSTILYYYNNQPVYAPEEHTTLILTDINRSELEFRRTEYGGAEIFITGTNDTIYIPKFFDSTGRYQIDKIVLQQENIELSLADYIGEFNKATTRSDILNFNDQNSGQVVDLKSGSDRATVTNSFDMSLYGGEGNDSFTTSSSNNIKAFGDLGNDSFTLYSSSNILAYGGEGEDNFSVYGGGVNILNGGEGFDYYDIKNVSGTQIYDADFSGLIPLDKNVVYFRWSEGNSLLSVPNQGTLIQEYPNENNVNPNYNHKDYAYGANTRRQVDVEYNALDGTLKVVKKGTSWNSSFKDFTDGFTYFEIKGLNTVNDLQQLMQNMQLSVGSESYQYIVTGQVINFLATTLDFGTFLSQGTVTQRYGDIDNQIIGLSENRYYDSHLDTVYYAGDMIYSGSGSDNINVGLGSSLIHSGAGDDVIVAPDTLSINTIYAEDGDDYIEIGKGQAYGGLGNDMLIGHDTLYGGDGNDTIIALETDDILDGGLGVDNLQGGMGNDLYFVDNILDVVLENVEQGVDTVNSSLSYTLTSNVENLTLIGSSSINGTGNSLNNILIGNASNNILSGGDGDDELNGGGGNNDRLIGGSGDDTYTIESSGISIVENANEGIDTVKSYASYTMAAHIENLVLLWEAKTAKGNDLDNRIIGNDLDNTLAGGIGNDYLDGGIGADKLQGGVGNDSYVIDHLNDAITERASEGIDTVHSKISFELISSVENLILIGTDHINATGNSLVNNIKGNSGNNILNASAGNDLLDGQEGNDQFIGGLGSDTVIYSLLDQTDSLGGNGYDVWNDFTVGKITTNANADKIDVGDLLIGFTGQYSVVDLDPFIKMQVNGSNTELYIDRDGVGSAYNGTLLLTLNNVNASLNDLISNQQLII